MNRQRPESQPASFGVETKGVALPNPDAAPLWPQQFAKTLQYLTQTRHKASPVKPVDEAFQDRVLEMHLFVIGDLLHHLADKPAQPADEVLVGLEKELPLFLPCDMQDANALSEGGDEKMAVVAANRLDQRGKVRGLFPILDINHFPGLKGSQGDGVRIIAVKR